MSRSQVIRIQQQSNFKLKQVLSSRKQTSLARLISIPNGTVNVLVTFNLQGLSNLN